MIVHDFKSINKILDRKEPGTEHDVPASTYAQSVSQEKAAAANYDYWHGPAQPPYTPQPSSHTPPFWSVPLDEALREFRNGEFEIVPSPGAPVPGPEGLSPSEWNEYYRGLMVQRAKI